MHGQIGKRRPPAAQAVFWPPCLVYPGLVRENKGPPGAADLDLALQRILNEFNRDGGDERDGAVGVSAARWNFGTQNSDCL